MPFFSNQVFFWRDGHRDVCRACGKEMFIHANAPYGAKVCNAQCFEELEWRTTLSIMGKEYYPKAQKGLDGKWKSGND